MKFVLGEDCTINEISRRRIVPEVGGRWEKAELEVAGKAGRLGLFDSVSWNLPSALRDSETTSDSAVWLAASGGWLVDREESLMTSAAAGISLGDLGSLFWPSEAPMACSKGGTSPNVEDV